MKITVENYENALKGFLSDVELMKDDVISVLLFGSMARGEIRPGRSDVMDAFVFFKPEVFSDRECFLKVLHIMAGACERLSQSGLVYHPFLYWENIDLISGLFLPPCRSDRSSQIIFGQEMRHTAECSPASRFLASKTFFAARRYGHQLAYFLSKPQLTEVERERIADELLRGRKVFPMLACMTLDIWAGESEVIHELKKALPDVDTSVLEKIKILRDRPESIADADCKYP